VFARLFCLFQNKLVSECALRLVLKCTLFRKDGVEVYLHLDATRVCKSICIWLQLEACAAASGQSASVERTQEGAKMVWSVQLDQGSQKVWSTQLVPR